MFEDDSERAPHRVGRPKRRRSWHDFDHHGLEAEDVYRAHADEARADQPYWDRLQFTLQRGDATVNCEKN